MNIEVIPIHFDVPGHEIPLATFVRTSQQTEAVVQALSGALFRGQLRFELVVLPPEDGTFLARLKVVAVVVGAAVAFVELDIGKGLVEGLTGHEPAYWAKELGEGITALTEAAISEAQELQPVELETRIVSEMARSFLSRDNDDLARRGINPRQYREAFEAKNEFYLACIETPELRAVGFSDEPVFPIQRSDFVRLQAVLPPKEDDDPEPPWTVEVSVVKVTSPNWDRADRGRRWKGRDQQGRDRLFLIEDESFWQRVSADAIHTHVIDVMKVQWVFQGTSEQRRNVRVLRVLEFNGQSLSEALSGAELEAEVGQLREVDVPQGGLFD